MPAPMPAPMPVPSAHPAFRTAEKHFKTRAAPHPNPAFAARGKRVPARPSLLVLPRGCRGVLDLSRLGGPSGARAPPPPPDAAVPVVRLRNGRSGFIVAPGCVLIPSHLPPDAQLALLRAALVDYSAGPTSLDTHYAVPAGLIRLAADAPGTPVPPRHASLSAAELERLRARERASPGGRKRVDTAPDGVGVLVGTDDARGRARDAGGTGEADGTGCGRQGGDSGAGGAEGPDGADAAPLPSSRVGVKRADELLRELRWANLGLFYNWTHKAYDLSRTTPPFPADLAAACADAVRAVRWDEVLGDDTGASWADDYAPETGIVNFYQLGDTLMAHVDRSELDPSRPLVSISVGHAAILLLGTESRDDPPLPLILRSGDVLIMAGPGRRAYHGVPRVLEGTLPVHFEPSAEDEDEMRAAKAFIATARININARQVFPPGAARAAACAA